MSVRFSQPTDSVDLDWFVGKTFELTGVDTSTISIAKYSDEKYADCSVINFTLNGITYCAIEDPSDGYRSSLYDIRIVKDVVVKNEFPACLVMARVGKSWEDGSIDTVTFHDASSDEIVLEIGTDHTDDYYPSFVAYFSPRAMAVNKKMDEEKLSAGQEKAESEYVEWGEF